MYDAITGHIAGHLRLWTILGLGVSALAILAMAGLGKVPYLPEIITLGAMFGGTTMILASQRGMPQPAAEAEGTA
jgi:hypothetical protein